MSRKEKAVELKHNGYNCCQAVLCSFTDEVNLPEDTLKQMGASFGGGMGCLEATWGALCGAQMLLGLKTYEGKPIVGNAAKIHKEFTNVCGASICKELKGIETGKMLCACDDCVRNAVEIIEKAI